jgi:hypothetical protein
MRFFCNFFQTSLYKKNLLNNLIFMSPFSYSKLNLGGQEGKIFESILKGNKLVHDRIKLYKVHYRWPCPYVQHHEKQPINFRSLHSHLLPPRLRRRSPPRLRRRSPPRLLRHYLSLLQYHTPVQRLDLLLRIQYS